MRDEIEGRELENKGRGGPGGRVPPTFSCIPSTASTPSQPFPLHIFPSVPKVDRTQLLYQWLHEALRG